MDYEILQVLPVSREILLVITRRMGKRNQHLSRKTAFRRNTSRLPPKAEQTSVVELTLDTWLWQSFQASCANLEITPEDCFNAWLYFWVTPESHEAANGLLCGRKEH